MVSEVLFAVWEAAFHRGACVVSFPSIINAALKLHMMLHMMLLIS